MSQQTVFTERSALLPKRSCATSSGTMPWGWAWERVLPGWLKMNWWKNLTCPANSVTFFLIHTRYFIHGIFFVCVAWFEMVLVFGSHSFVCLQFLAENPSAKRKSLTSPEGKPSKKLKTSDTPGEDSGIEKGEKKRKKKKDALGMPLSPTIWGHMQVSWLVCTLSCIS